MVKILISQRVTIKTVLLLVTDTDFMYQHSFMCWGKSKCGATVCWLVGEVAPLLILSKRWLFCSFFVC